MSFAVAFPVLLLAFPECTDGASMRNALGVVALGMKITGDFTPAVASSVVMNLSSLVSLLHVECSSMDTLHRIPVVLRLHAAMPGGVAAGAVSTGPGGSVSGASSDNDKLMRDPDFADLQTRLIALPRSGSGAIVKLLAGHKHPAGLVFMTTTRSIGVTVWAGFVGVRARSTWLSALDAALAVDSLGVAQPAWGHMLPCAVDGKSEVANSLMLHKFDAVKDWWSLASKWVEKREGHFAFKRLRALASPVDFWLSSDHMRIAAVPLATIMDYVLCWARAESQCPWVLPRILRVAAVAC